MHILGAKPFVRFLEAKKPSLFRVEARLLQLHSRAENRAGALQALRKDFKS